MDTGRWDCAGGGAVRPGRLGGAEGRAGVSRPADAAGALGGSLHLQHGAKHDLLGKIVMASSESNNPLVESPPPAVRAAVLAQDEQALEQALLQMPRAEAEALAKWLVVAGILVQSTGAQVNVEQPAVVQYPPGVAAALAAARADGNLDHVYEALAELPNEEADRLYALLQQQGLL